MSLFQQSGGDPDSRRVEADRIYRDLFPFVPNIGVTFSNGKKSVETVQFIMSMRPGANRSVSVKQLFWLRDLHDRYVKGL